MPDLIWGGKGDCEHQWGNPIEVGDFRFRGVGAGVGSDGNPEVYATGKGLSMFCLLCGAWKGQYGLEPTPEMYLEHTLIFLREIRRVLRKDGVVFWNIGDSYMSGGGSSRHFGYTDPKHPIGRKVDYLEPTAFRHNSIKPKDLCLIPFRVAIAAQEDGWWVRSIIIWVKPNPMPESVTDRPTESHEYILMLTKSKNYYWDVEAVREPISESYADDKRPHGVLRQHFYPNSKYVKAGMMEAGEGLFPSGERATGRNIRSVWIAPSRIWQLRADLSASDRAFVLGELLKREILNNKNDNDNAHSE